MAVTNGDATGGQGRGERGVRESGGDTGDQLKHEASARDDLPLR